MSFSRSSWPRASLTAASSWPISDAIWLTLVRVVLRRCTKTNTSNSLSREIPRFVKQFSSDSSMGMGRAKRVIPQGVNENRLSQCFEFAKALHVDEEGCTSQASDRLLFAPSRIVPRLNYRKLFNLAQLVPKCPRWLVTHRCKNPAACGDVSLGANKLRDV